MLNNADPEVWAYLSLVCLRTARQLEAEQAYKYAIKVGMLPGHNGVYVNRKQNKSLETILYNGTIFVRKFIDFLHSCSLTLTTKIY